jgi:hypothetical protein
MRTATARRTSISISTAISTGGDIRRPTRGDAIFLYHRCFWLRLQAETFAQPVGEMLFDQAVNGGLATARKLLQRAINNCLLLAKASARKPGLLMVDGAIGNATRDALLWVLGYPGLGMPALVAEYRSATRERYQAIVRRFPSKALPERLACPCRSAGAHQVNLNFLRGFDNAHIDLGRVLWAIGLLAYLALTAFAVHRGQQIDWTNWALGFALLHSCGAGGAGIKDVLVAKAFALKQDASA